jgi:hypothetical protein
VGLEAGHRGQALAGEVAAGRVDDRHQARLATEARAQLEDLTAQRRLAVQPLAGQRALEAIGGTGGIAPHRSLGRRWRRDVKELAASTSSTGAAASSGVAERGPASRRVMAQATTPPPASTSTPITSHGATLGAAVAAEVPPPCWVSRLPRGPAAGIGAWHFGHRA